MKNITVSNDVWSAIPARSEILGFSGGVEKFKKLISKNEKKKIFFLKWKFNINL